MLAAAATGSAEVAYELGKTATEDELEQAAVVATEHEFDSIRKMLQVRVNSMSSEL